VPHNVPSLERSKIINHAMRSQPLVSIAVPAYNAATTIGAMIASVLAQTYSNFELIICDDASNDGTATIIQGVDDERIRFLCNPHNMGEGASRDHAISACRGDWIAVLDADDAWHPQRLAKLVEAAATDTGAMVFDDIMECHNTAQGLKFWRTLRGPKAFDAKPGMAIDVDPALWICSERLLIKPIIPAAALRGYGVKHSKLQFGADTEFFLKLIACGMRLRYLPKAYYYYRITPGSMSALPARYRLMRKMLEEVGERFEYLPSMRSALQNKSEAIGYLEKYHDFLASMRSHDFRKAIVQIRNDPFVIPELIGRLVNDIPYRLHRLLNRGTGRR
jgi:glycosyltransferase involved in cell wall biosynthesis